jgi:hypothetical protein
VARSLKLLAISLVVSWAVAAADRAVAESIGFLHMPSTVAQYLGYGYGAGHHVPIVRTPAQRPAPIPRRAAPPPCYGPLYPAAYAPIGCYDSSCSCLQLGPPMAEPMPAEVPPPSAYRPGAPYGWR